MIKDRVVIFLNFIKGTDVADVDELVEELICSAGEYINSIISLEAGIVCGRLTKAAEEYRGHLAELREKKNKCHNSFVSNIKIINRFLKNFNFPILFDGDDENKPEVEKFALELVSEFVGQASSYIKV